MPNYKVFTYTNKDGLKVVKVGSTYAGKPVWGYAACAPGDTYDYELGYKIAKARCDVKVAKLREKRATAQYDLITEEIDALTKYLPSRYVYMFDSVKARVKAEHNLREVIASCQK